jgi:colanic acid biosynthesis glycosyl transferase WcaI
MAKHWVSMGHQVTVLTDFPNHPDGKVYPSYKKRFLRFSFTENDGEVKVVRAAHLVRPNKGSLNRLISYSSFTASAALRSIPIKDVDVVIGTVPQPLHALAAWFKAKLSRTPFILEIRDLWPESIAGTGQSSENSLSYRMLGWVARFLYARADAHIAVTDAIKDWTVDHYGVDESNSTVIPAGVDSDFFKSGEISARDTLPADSSAPFVVTYVGTLGNAHGIEVVLEAAKQIETTHPQISFSIVGAGADYERLLDIVENDQISNVSFTGRVQRNQIPAILAKADLCLAVLRDSPVFRTAVPTKLYEYMAAGKPMITNVAGEATLLIERSGSGMSVPPADAVALANAIVELHDSPEKCRQFGMAGQAFVETDARWESRAEAYEKVLRLAVERRNNL